MVEVNVVFVVKQEIVNGKIIGDDSQNTVIDLELCSIQEGDNQNITKGSIVYSQGKGKIYNTDHQKEVVMMHTKQATQENTYWQTNILLTNPRQLVKTMVVTEDVDPIQHIMELNQIIIEEQRTFLER
jgi:hypothetical protein